MNWFTSLFKSNKQNQNLPLPLVEIPITSISEPVLSFVEVFKDNPKRFKLFYNRDKEWLSCSFMFEWTIESPISMKLVDLKENLEWTFLYWPSRNYGLPVSSYPVFLNPEESNYIYKTISEHHSKRFQEFLKTKDRVNLKRGRKEREALKKVYCK